MSKLQTKWIEDGATGLSGVITDGDTLIVIYPA